MDSEEQIENADDSNQPSSSNRRNRAQIQRENAERFREMIANLSTATTLDSNYTDSAAAGEDESLGSYTTTAVDSEELMAADSTSSIEIADLVTETSNAESVTSIETADLVTEASSLEHASSREAAELVTEASSSEHASSREAAYLVTEGSSEGYIESASAQRAGSPYPNRSHDELEVMVQLVGHGESANAQRPERQYPQIGDDDDLPSGGLVVQGVPLIESANAQRPGSPYPHIDDADEMAAGGAEANPLMEDNYDGAESSSSDVVADERDGQRRWNMQAQQVNAAVRELVSQSWTRDSGVGGLLDRSNLLQHIRRAIYSMEHARQVAFPRREYRNRRGLRLDQEMDADDENENENGIDTDSDDNDSEQQAEETEPLTVISFDTNLPAEHSYLGDNMNRVYGVNYLEAGTSHKLILFMHQHILFPGEILPFMISSSIIEHDIDSQNGLLFGVCFPSLRGSEHDDNIYGVTCQIYEKGTDERGNLLIKSRALQRFATRANQLTGNLQSIAADPQIKCYGYIKVLPEIYLREPLKCQNMGSMSRFRDLDSMHFMYRRFQASSTPWPAHVYDYYSTDNIIKTARTQLAQHKIDTMPADPVQLSFWLVRNLHLSENMIKSIFTTDSVNTRLKLISTTFKEDAIFICRYCSNRIANCRELFAMSKHGVQTQYCNSSGYIHETNTVYQLLRNAISYNGEPSMEFSWFPGYQWHIIVCKSCSRHIGWEFKAIETHLVPKTFYGISSSSVRVSVPNNLPRNPRAVIYRSLMRMARRQMH